MGIWGICTIEGTILGEQVCCGEEDRVNSSRGGNKNQIHNKVISDADEFHEKRHNKQGDVKEND